jgi:hypothetical protein
MTATILPAGAVLAAGAAFVAYWFRRLAKGAQKALAAVSEETIGLEAAAKRERFLAKNMITKLFAFRAELTLHLQK